MSASSLKRKAKDAQDDFESTIAALRESLSSKDLDDIPEVAKLRERLEEGLGELEGSAQDILKDAKRKSKKAARAANELVHNEPWQAVGVALAVGAVITFLACRR